MQKSRECGIVSNDILKALYTVSGDSVEYINLITEYSHTRDESGEYHFNVYAAFDIGV